jgi:hypothetical protein
MTIHFGAAKMRFAASRMIKARIQTDTHTHTHTQTHTHTHTHNAYYFLTD